MGFCLHSPLMGVKAFLFSPPALVSRFNKPVRVNKPSRERSGKISAMKKVLLVLAAASVVLVSNSFAGNFAARVLSYSPGSGAVSGYNDANTILGAPSQVNPFGEAVDPFNPPYGTDQILSVGEGGSVTIQFAESVKNSPRNPYGLDFIVFGNSGFIITNDFDFQTFNWLGTPATDGSLFAHNNGGATRVSVSRDGVRFYTLNPSLAPTLDNLFPSDSAGAFDVPVNPALGQLDFAGQTLDGIRALYAGSAGGAGFDVSWAQDERGRPVHLPFINYVRVEVLSGKIEVDAFSAVSRVRGED
jgi:hypothetical protein